jgi:hypothetical protein
MSRGSIRDLAQFVATDAFVKFAQPLTTEQIVLASYTFLPYARSGIAATLTTPFSFAAPARATVNVTVPIVADAGTVVAGPVAVTVRGPGDVTGIDAAQVIRTWPMDGHANSETEDLVHVEFDRPDLPWMFTPAAPDAQGRLVPWVTLIVAARGSYTLEHPPGKAALIHVNRDQLQSLDDAWAWAHAQAMGATNRDDPNARTSVEQRLSDVNPTMNLSRLVCPRHLDPDTEYIACIVPTFQAGVEAATSGDVKTTTLAPAWTAGGQADAPIALPVYYSFTFATGAAGNFESLARQLRSIPAPPNIGRRRLDTSNPGNGIDPVPEGETGREQVVEGPVVSLADASVQDGWPSAAEQEWPAATTGVLREQLNAADVNMLAPEAGVPDEPTVTPPIYAGTATARTRVEDASPEWFRDLNLEPKHRVVAGLGTRVVQMDQEALMASAWNQVSGVEAANRALRWAQFARYVSASLHRRHLAVLGPGAQLALTERVHSRVLESVNTTVYARVERSSLPRSATSAGFRRLTRARGPVTRFAAAAVLDRAAGVNRLIAEDAGLTRDWVRTYVNPDGVAFISATARAMVTDALAAEVFGPSVSKDAALDASSSTLTSRSAFPDALTADAIKAVPQPREGALGTTFDAGILGVLLSTMPSPEEMRASRAGALAGAGHALLLRQFVDAASAHAQDWPVDKAQAIRLGLPQDTSGYDPSGYDTTGPSTTSTSTTETTASTTPEALASSRQPAARAAVVPVRSSALLELASATDAPARQYGIQPAELSLENAAGARLATTIRAAATIRGNVVEKALLQIADRLVRAVGPTDISRDRIDVPALALVTKLDPAVTVTARIKGRLGVLPAWLRPDWFDNLRIDPVMAGPTFPFPMCQALYRYDQSWMIPGVAGIARTDMVTLLKTNNEFVEAFLVGLNHEMGRELLWRGYPTDARGTYFKSFWTGNDELASPIHQFADTSLGKHMLATLDNRIVMLVRGELVHRYPGVIGHAVRQAGTDAPTGLPLFEAGEGAKVLFRVHLAPNILLVAFDLLPDTVKAPGPAWWFLLAENPTEPRFGLDDVAVAGEDPRNNLTWDQLLAGLPADQRRFLRASSPHLVVDDVTWGSDAAANAHLLFQLPARAAFLGTRMLTNVGV